MFVYIYIYIYMYIFQILETHITHECHCIYHTFSSVDWYIWRFMGVPKWKVICPEWHMLHICHSDEFSHLSICLMSQSWSIFSPTPLAILSYMVKPAKHHKIDVLSGESDWYHTISFVCSTTTLLGTLLTNGTYQMCFHWYAFPWLCSNSIANGLGSS